MAMDPFRGWFGPPRGASWLIILYESNILKTLTNTDKFDGDLGYAMNREGQ